MGVATKKNNTQDCSFKKSTSFVGPTLICKKTLLTQGNCCISSLWSYFKMWKGMLSFMGFVNHSLSFCGICSDNDYVILSHIWKWHQFCISNFQYLPPRTPWPTIRPNPSQQDHCRLRYAGLAASHRRWWLPNHQVHHRGSWGQWHRLEDHGWSGLYCHQTEHPEP